MPARTRESHSSETGQPRYALPPDRARVLAPALPFCPRLSLPLRLTDRSANDAAAGIWPVAQWPRRSSGRARSLPCTSARPDRMIPAGIAIGDTVFELAFEKKIISLRVFGRRARH